MSYIDAGYAIALGVLALYAGMLWRRRSRLERLAGSSGPAEDGRSGEFEEMPGALRGPP